MTASGGCSVRDDGDGRSAAPLAMMATRLLQRHCEERSDEAIQKGGGGKGGVLRLRDW
jgi:hypothetical protein